MFRDVFTAEQRRELKARVAVWEAAHPGEKPADRVTAWIDLAYAYQAESRPSVIERGPSALASRGRRPHGVPAYG